MHCSIKWFPGICGFTLLEGHGYIMGIIKGLSVDVPLYRLNGNVVTTFPTRIKAIQVLSRMESAVAVPWHSDEHDIPMVLHSNSKNF